MPVAFSTLTSFADDVILAPVDSKSDSDYTIAFTIRNTSRARGGCESHKNCNKCGLVSLIETKIHSYFRMNNSPISRLSRINQLQMNTTLSSILSSKLA